MRQITKAMKLVSASKLKRAQNNITAARPYARKLRELLTNLVASAGEYKHPLMEQHEDNYYTIVVVTTDKGLCGALNTNLLKLALQFIRENPGKKIDFVTIGRKGRDFARRRNFLIKKEYIGLVSKTVSYSQASEIGNEITKQFSEEQEGSARPDKVFLLYNEFSSALQQKQIFQQLLPVGNQTEATEAKEGAIDYFYEQSPEEILSTLLPLSIDTQIFTAILDSVASEHGARMTAMDSASKNASELIDKLTLGMNRVRQAAITRDIIEVVSGAAAAQ